MLKKLLILTVITLSIMSCLDLAFAYPSIITSNDGKLDDWGVSPGIYGASQWVPLPGISYKEEDQNTSKLGPGYGGQLFDAEALYIYYDNTTLYYAVVTGHPATGASGWQPGDIAFDFGQNGSYEYGIRTRNNGLVKGALYSVKTWGRGLNAWDSIGPFGYWSEPTEILAINGTALATGPFTYNNTYYGLPSQGSHYVIEGSIPHIAFGDDWEWGNTFNVHWTQTCGNDAIDLPVTITPEPGTMTLLGLGLLGLLVRKRRK